MGGLGLRGACLLACLPAPDMTQSTALLLYCGVVLCALAVRIGLFSVYVHVTRRRRATRRERRSTSESHPVPPSQPPATALHRSWFFSSSACVGI